MKTLDYNFPVKLTPLVTKPYGVEVPKKLAVMRADTKQPLGIVSSKYGLIPHGEVIDSFRKALTGTKHEERIQIMKNGAHLFATYKLSSQTIEVRKGDLVALQFVVRNSYDWSNTLQIMLGAFRLVCSNGMVIGKSYFSYSQRHISSEAGMKIEVISEKISVLLDQFKKTLPFLQQMSREKIGQNPDKFFNPKAVKLPSYLLHEAHTAFQENSDETVWGYYNSLTQAITHHMKKENPRLAIHFGRIAWSAAQNALTR